MISLKHAYDAASRADGTRVLVERLWPRGIRKEALAMDDWLKDVAPSTELRKWYAHQPERFEEFTRRYRKELDRKQAVWEPLLSKAAHHRVTLLFATHDVEHSSAQVLKDYLQEHAHPRE